jgi:hypothetical protein
MLPNTNVMAQMHNLRYVRFHLSVYSDYKIVGSLEMWDVAHQWFNKVPALEVFTWDGVYHGHGPSFLPPTNWQRTSVGQFREIPNFISKITRKLHLLYGC